MRPGEEHDRDRRRLLRRLDWILAAIWGGVAVAALGGGALVAWFLMGAGMPFLRTWLTLSALLVLVPALVHLLPGRRRNGNEAD